MAYRELCLRMGLCPPNTYQDVMSAMMAGDSSMNGRISRMEMFILFKRIQGINMGIMMGNDMCGWGNGWGMGGMGGMGMGGGMGIGFTGIGMGMNMGGW
jgi:hypothetical protein